MGRLSELFKKLIPRKKQIDEASAEALRLDFKARYQFFKRLISANNKALESMTEIEEALRGTSPFGMSFVTSRCTRVATSVWQIVQNMCDLAPGKHEILFDRFKNIQIQINPFIRRKTLVYLAKMMEERIKVLKEQDALPSIARFIGKNR